MGLFDKIKKAVNDSGVVDAAKKTLENLMTAEETNSKEVKAKVAETPTQQPKPKTPPKPACDKGECVVCDAQGNGKRLYFTCGKDVECPKKKENKLGELWDENIFPAIKAYDKLKKASNARNYDYYKVSKAEKSVAAKIINAYVPEIYSSALAENASSLVYVDEGIREEQFLPMYFSNLKGKLKEKGYEISDFRKNSFSQVMCYVAKAPKFDIKNAEWLFNPGLYQRNENDIRYTVLALGQLTSEEWSRLHLLDTSVINFNELYDEKGLLKPAGTDGKAGDTIYNLVEKWSKNNENTEVFEREAAKRRKLEEEQRRMEICRNCARYFDCNTHGMMDNCSAYIPKTKSSW